MRKTEPLAPRLLRTPDAAAYMGISPGTLRAMAHRGEIPYVPGPVWRFDVRILDKWTDENQTVN